MNNNKVIVSNFKALTEKYGSNGLAQIKDALKSLIAKDKEEGLTSQIVDLSSGSQMSKLGGQPVTIAPHQQQVKDAVDAIYRALVPAYILLLGSIDIIPHQDLENPVSDPEEGDPDPVVPSDLPYACDVAYNQNPARFVGPTRVVGRLPDLTAATEPSYLLKLIEIAANRQSRDASEYATHFGISAFEWRGSSELSLQKLFGSSKLIQHSPDMGPEWTEIQLAAMSHFINCHGVIAKPIFYGQDGASYPVAHRTSHITGKIPEGAVAAVECCYGASLYDPVDAQGVMPICNAYLASGAYGYCGSTTVSYGPAEGNAQADLICRYFLQRMMGGSSLGRAMLEARQQLAQSAAQLDPFDLKTLAQFSLLGDPSIHPVARMSSTRSIGRATTPVGDVTSRSVNRTDRRRLLCRVGEQIRMTQLVPTRRPDLADVNVQVTRKLRSIAREAGVDGNGKVLGFSLAPSTDQTASALRENVALAKLPAPNAYYVMAKRYPAAGENDIAVRAVVARGVDGKIVAYRRVLSR